MLHGLQYHTKDIMKCLHNPTPIKPAIANEHGVIEKTDLEHTYYHVIGCIYNVLLPDTQAKMNLASVRQSTLALGIVDIAQCIQKTYRHNERLNQIISALLEIIISDWS